MRLYLVRMVLAVSALVLGPSAAGAELICDPDNAHLFVSAGEIEDRRVHIGSRTFDSGVEAPTVLIECVAEDGTTPEEIACSAGFGKVFVTWHADGGQVEAQCMRDGPPPSVAPDQPETPDAPMANEISDETGSERVQD